MEEVHLWVFAEGQEGAVSATTYATQHEEVDVEKRRMPQAAPSNQNTNIDETNYSVRTSLRTDEEAPPMTRTK